MTDQLQIALKREQNKLERQERNIQATKTLIAMIRQELAKTEKQR